MATNAGSLKVFLEMQTRAFDKAMNSVIGRIRGLHSTVALVAGTLGIGSLARSAVELGGQLSDLSASLGIQTTKLNDMRRLAMLSGVGLDAMARAALNLSKGLGEADPKFDAAIKKLGLTTEELKKMDEGERLVNIAKKLLNITDITEKTDIINRIFGLDAPELISALDEIGKSATRAGTEFQNMFGKLTGDQIEKLDQIGDAWDLTWDNIKEATGAALASMSEDILDFFKDFNDLLDAAKKGIEGKGWGEFMRTLTGGSSGDPASSFSGLFGFAAKLGSGVGTGIRAGDEALSGNQFNARMFQDMSYRYFASAWDDIKSIFGFVGDSAGGLVGAVDESNTILVEIRDGIRTFSSANRGIVLQ